MQAMAGLAWLSICGCSLVTDQGLRAVAELECLTHLNLCSCSLVRTRGCRQ